MTSLLSPPASLKETLLRELHAVKIRRAIYEAAASPSHPPASKRRPCWGIPSPTRKGDIVRSRGEQIIADFLFKHQIPYEYEPQIALGEQRLHPDFYLLGADVYIEYWGVTGDPYYAKKKGQKLALYQQYSIAVISLYQTDLPYLALIFDVDGS
ncbi:MAG: hypothetical protein ACFFFG_11915 [Candidatus Thorarchaeota archaeon]